MLPNKNGKCFNYKVELESTSLTHRVDVLVNQTTHGLIACFIVETISIFNLTVLDPPLHPKIKGQ